MPEKMSSIELYKKVREPLEVTKEMRDGATTLQKEEENRAGNNNDEDADYTKKWEKKINEENMQDDHGAYNKEIK